jgi:hypothetical protein
MNVDRSKYSRRYFTARTAMHVDRDKRCRPVVSFMVADCFSSSVYVTRKDAAQVLRQMRRAENQKTS